MESLPTASNFEKFRLLLWKNLVLTWRKKYGILLNLILSLLFCLVLVIERAKERPQEMDVTIYDKPIPIDNLDLLNYTHYHTFLHFSDEKNDSVFLKKTITAEHLGKLRFHLAYAPEKTCYEEIVKLAANSLGLTYSSYSSARKLQDALEKQRFLAGIKFYYSKNCHENLNYQIRFPSHLRTSENKALTWMTNQLFVRNDPIGPRNRDNEDGGVPVGYLREGFLPVQYAISTAFLNLSAKKFKDQKLPKVVLQRFPYPKYKKDDSILDMADIVPLAIVFNYMYIVMNTVIYIVAEKEKQLKEVMKIMGLSNWLNWTAWFVQAFLMMSFSSLILTIILTRKWGGKDNVAILTNSSFTAVYFFFLVYAVTSITFSFLLAAMFMKTSIAIVATSDIYFMTYYPYFFCLKNYEDLTLCTKLVWSLFCNTALGFGFHVIIAFEKEGEGFQWSKMFEPVNADDSLSMGHILLMMVISSCIYMLICLYLEQMCIGDYGIPQKWYFPLTKAFLFGEPPAIRYRGVVYSRDSKREISEAYEPEPLDKPIGIQTINLKKSFGELQAVKRLSLNMFEGEITVMLGHNGAGKSTIISMLTGMLPPTSGTAIINGYDIRTDIDKVRMSLGICPQNNILFDDLTVKEHLMFFSRLKGLKGNDLDMEVKKYLKILELENKANVYSSKLSGGMRRRLSVCAALCGPTKVVLCDEPSSGLDPAARRKQWDLLQSERTGRTILLTTHFMDEADLLGDRIAILCEGELKCMGSSFFLKKLFGGGFKLICEKKSECDTKQVTKLLSQYIPGIQPQSDIGTELSYHLPDKYSSQFPIMLLNLEKESKALAINGYGISITSIEEVFMKVGTENSESPHGQTSPMMSGVSGSKSRASTTSESIFSENQRLLTGPKLFANQWRAMLWKKILYTKRNKLLFAIQNLTPIFFIALEFLVTDKELSPLQPLKMDFTRYPHTVTVLQTSSDVRKGSLEQEISSNYKAIIKSQSSSHQLKDIGNQTFIDYMLKLGQTHQAKINFRYIAAASIDKGTIIAWLNNKPLHSAPLTLNLIHNAMAKTVIGPKASISVSNSPLPSVVVNNVFEAVGNLVTILEFSLCMTTVSALYALFVIKENQSRAKLLQFVSGVNVLTFWLSHFIWDFTTFALTGMISIITLACFQEKGYSTFGELARLFAIILLFGCSVLPFTYLLAGIFTEPAVGFTRIFSINLVCGCVLFFISLLLNIKYETYSLEKFFLIFPHFSFAQSMFKLYKNGQSRQICGKIPENAHCTVYKELCCPVKPYFGWDNPGILREICYLSTSTGVFLFILILKEYYSIESLYLKIKEIITLPPPQEDEYYDEDVKQEKIRVSNMSKSEISLQNLVIDKLTKFYGNFVAVNQISVGVEHTECFGLLGVNGAGKTATFKMLTGDERISSGDAFVKGLSVNKQMNAVYRKIGYCPQFDALFDDFTGRETIQIYALLRGVPVNSIPQMSLDLAKFFSFMEHYDKKVGEYSGGNRRKLSTVVAVIGGPSVIYLDEPTTGMDPVVRRKLWNIVCWIRDSGKSIVLSSHNMEECEALCTRLAIMVNGELKCIGSTQHLKNKFSKGLILKIKTRRKSGSDIDSEEADTNKLLIALLKMIPDAILQQKVKGLLTFYIPLASISWSRIFGIMESKKRDIKIEDYSISQTTLEEIFLQFADYQREGQREVM